MLHLPVVSLYSAHIWVDNIFTKFSSGLADLNLLTLFFRGLGPDG